MKNHATKQTMKRTPVYRADYPLLLKNSLYTTAFTRQTLVLLSLTKTVPKSIFNFLSKVK